MIPQCELPPAGYPWVHFEHPSAQTRPLPSVMSFSRSDIIPRYEITFCPLPNRSVSCFPQLGHDPFSRSRASFSLDTIPRYKLPPACYPISLVQVSFSSDPTLSFCCELPSAQTGSFGMSFFQSPTQLVHFEPPFCLDPIPSACYELPFCLDMIPWYKLPSAFDLIPQI